MKRTKLWLAVLVLAIPLILGGIVAYTYYNTGPEDMPSAPLHLNGITVEYSSYEWQQPVIWGLAYKPLKTGRSLEATNLGTLNQATLPLDLPAGFTGVVKLEQEGETLWLGMAEEWESYSFARNGKYTLEVTCEKPEREAEDGTGYGSLHYRAVFQVEITPSLSTSGERVAQGDVLAIRIDNLTEDITPTAHSEAERLTFVESGQGSVTCFVPVSYTRETGDYFVSVTAGRQSWEVHYRVVAGDFSRQDLEIDTTSEVITEANSAAAYEQYREVMYPIFDAVDETRYWEGVFIAPVSAEYTSTSYGLYRYTNGSSEASRHAGVDYSAPEGAEIIAPNNGRVVLAEYLLNTGYTLVIDHGGGLKSYFFHMNTLEVTEGDMVAQGDTVGTVGSTGYSTGPHLHYEVRILDQAINPSLLFDREGSSLFFEGS